MIQHCCRCDRDRSVEDFAPSLRGKGGQWCRDCRTEYMKAFRRTPEGKEATRRVNAKQTEGNRARTR
jgi:hypothetical protein